MWSVIIYLKILIVLSGTIVNKRGKMENIAKNWFQNIKRRTENIVGCNLTDDELKSRDESDKLESGEDYSKYHT